jgi:hypothetical protein
LRIEPTSPNIFMRGISSLFSPYTTTAEHKSVVKTCYALCPLVPENQPGFLPSVVS